MSCANFKIDIPDEIAAFSKTTVLRWISAHVVNRYNSQKMPPVRDAGTGRASPYGAYYGRHNLIATYTRRGENHTLETMTTMVEVHRAWQLKEAAEKAAAIAEKAAAVAAADSTVVAAAAVALGAALAATKAYVTFNTALQEAMDNESDVDENDESNESVEGSTASGPVDDDDENISPVDNITVVDVDNQKT